MVSDINIVVSISLFFVVTVMYIVIIDVFTILFRITGMTEEKAHFQVISLLTNSGFTTKESEVVVEVLARRKLARTIMLFGYVFSITIVSMFINMVLALPVSEFESFWPSLIIVPSLFALFLWVKRRPKLKKYFSLKVESWGKKVIYGGKDNAIILVDILPRGEIAKVYLNKLPAGMEGRSVGGFGLQEKYGIHLIFVDRGGELIHDTSKDTVLMEGDIIAVFGKIKDIEKLFAYADGEKKTGVAKA